ncbi:hypothetical protein [Flavobacterium aquidurense]|uniref:Putative membrane protein/domain-containing protein n=1 Tax=Flavobacterium aquidurense TaxID=362413 RepID=A0A0Q0S0D9_9FLAO|nr:hypothetical protein [Flavobacterium aquidurense]KQB38401.1 putative membrane protein/domain-containing protein [Flavobacterium aquidurense]
MAIFNYDKIIIKSRHFFFDALSFLGKSGRIWHDAISATYVVDKNALDSDIKFHDLNLIGVPEVN